MDSKKIDSYLFNEMNEAEREKFENEFVSDETLFSDVADRENELVDAYARGEMSGEAAARFERTLESLPARKQKVANARVLLEYISDERPVAKTITIAERTGFFSKLFAVPAFQFASLGAILLLAAAAMFLFVENRRLGSLEGELAAARTREAELSAQVESGSEATGELTARVEEAREQIANLEEQIGKLKGPEANTAPPKITTPTIATLLLSSVGVRGPVAPPRRLELQSGVNRVSVTIDVGDGVTSDRVSARLNGETAEKDLKVWNVNGGKRISLVISAARLKEGRNVITVTDASGSQVGEFNFVVSRK